MMTDQEILKLVDQYGLVAVAEMFEVELFAFARAIAAKEREACAVIVDAETDEWESKDICAILRDVAAEIRARAWSDVPDATKWVDELRGGVEEPPNSLTGFVESELVAWMFQHEETGLTECVDAQQVEWGFEKNNPRWQKIYPLYTTPPKREWVGLTDEEIGALTVFDGLHHVEVPLLADLARAIEFKLREKNT